MKPPQDIGQIKPRRCCETRESTLIGNLDGLSETILCFLIPVTGNGNARQRNQDLRLLDELTASLCLSKNRSSQRLSFVQFVQRA